MNEKIEINTLITKHENKYKNCRFDMIDVEDPLWEHGYPLKRVLIDNQTGETYDEVGKLVGLLNELETKCHKLEKENEELKQKVDFYKYFQKDARELERENERLRQKIKHYVYVDVDNTNGCMNCKYDIGSICSIMNCGTHDYLEGVSECGLKYWAWKDE